ncbi:MAG TPA: histidinol dehydrogenase [Anaerolineae bacterium]|nr:histidinol dehydrogenase [Anaerolineae bacterium]HIQ05714.1 histidinol dehydrogenase [Anaerolineae bacterium]
MTRELLRLYDDVSLARQTLLRRASWEEQKVPSSLLDGIEQVFGERLTPAEAVARLCADVRDRGDMALREWTTRIDGVTLEEIEVPLSAWVTAAERLAPELLAAMQLAAERIESFHRKQPLGSWIDFGPDGALGQLVRPVDSVGVYVPGGTAPLPSSLLMSAIPARVAGVPRVVVTTPPDRVNGRVSDLILAAAYLAGVDALYMLGGAQAIAALAYGTESIQRVDKIVGPGGLFVTLAKRHVYGIVGIEGLPGPTETMVIADDTADPALAAADLLAQAEHDMLASAILLTPARTLAKQVQREVARRLTDLSRAEIITRSLADRGGIVITADLDQAVALANEYGPEHLCLLVADPWALVGQVRNAGGIFLGEGSYEVLGDYVAGPSHVMPTEGTARFASPLNVADFVKRISLVGLNREAGGRLSQAAARLAEAETLTAHAAAARARVEG